jgi:ABC-type microcin C transport system duplicated ATPase subunit YejF
MHELAFKQMRPLRSMQVVFQDPFGSLSPRMSIADIVGEGLLIHARSFRQERDRRVAAALEEVGLDPRRAGAIRTSFPAASASASPSPGPWCSSRVS